MNNPYFQAGALHNSGKHADAERIYMRLLDEDFDNPVLLFAMGCCLSAQRKTGLAFSLLKRAVELMDDAHDAYKRLGILTNNHDPAERKRLVKKQKSEAYNAMAMCYRHENKPAEAMKLFTRAMTLSPEDADIYCNMGAMYVNDGAPLRGIPLLKRALDIQPDHLDAKWNLALLYLENHEYQKGFALYDAGERTRVSLSRTYTYPDGSILPLWDGSPGKDVLVYGEQGIGDEIMFASCVPDLMRISKSVVFDCHPRLVSLFEKSFGIECHGTRKDEWIEWMMGRKFDCRAPSGTLPHYFRNRVEDFPGKPYLKSDPMDLPFSKPRVGISWIGGVKQTRAAIRSIRLTEWAALLSKDCEWVNLQYNKREDDIQEVEWKQGVKIHHYPEIIYGHNYEETARLVKGLDLVISVCTSVIHLAGSLGVPCWVLVPDKPAWRYGTRGETMPWYGSVRLFRQQPGEPWTEVLKRVGDELEAYLGATQTQGAGAKAA